MTSSSKNASQNNVYYKHPQYGEAGFDVALLPIEHVCHATHFEHAISICLDDEGGVFSFKGGEPRTYEDMPHKEYVWFGIQPGGEVISFEEPTVSEGFDNMAKVYLESTPAINEHRYGSFVFRMKVDDFKVVLGEDYSLHVGGYPKGTHNSFKQEFAQRIIALPVPVPSDGGNFELSNLKAGKQLTRKLNTSTNNFSETPLFINKDGWYWIASIPQEIKFSTAAGSELPFHSKKQKDGHYLLAKWEHLEFAIPATRLRVAQSHMEIHVVDHPSSFSAPFYDQKIDICIPAKHKGAEFPFPCNFKEPNSGYPESDRRRGALAFALWGVVYRNVPETCWSVETLQLLRIFHRNVIFDRIYASVDDRNVESMRKMMSKMSHDENKK